MKEKIKLGILYATMIVSCMSGINTVADANPLPSTGYHHKIYCIIGTPAPTGADPLSRNGYHHKIYCIKNPCP